jgi:hypothetical protein
MRSRYRAVDPTTSVTLADGPLTTAGSCMRWESLGQVIANLVIVALALAILAVWVVQVDAPALRVMSGRDAGSPEQQSPARHAERRPPSRPGASRSPSFDVARDAVHDTRRRHH